MEEKEKDIEFEDVLIYIREMGTKDHLALFLPEERHEEFIELVAEVSKALARFKETVGKWAEESYEESSKLEDIVLLLKRGIKSPAVFLQEVERITEVKAQE